MRYQLGIDAILLHMHVAYGVRTKHKFVYLHETLKRAKVTGKVAFSKFPTCVDRITKLAENFNSRTIPEWRQLLRD